MMKKTGVFIFLFIYGLTAFSAALHKTWKLSQWGIPAANYSGITLFGDEMFAVVSDKELMDGYYQWQIIQDPITGQIQNILDRGFHGQVPLDTNSDGISLHDAEDIVYCPQRKSFFVCGEGYQDIVELDTQGCRTGYELPVPDYLRTIYPNYGFEALAYDSASLTFYTTTENVLPADGVPTSAVNHNAALLHIQAFNASAVPGQDGKPVFFSSEKYEYVLDNPRAKRVGLNYAHGVVAMTALGNGKLAVLEREAYVSQTYLGSWVYNKLYVVNLKESSGTHLNKQFITQWDTHIRVNNYSWANYEGMCLGQSLPDGRQTLILVSDSQGGYGIGPLHLKDYIRVIVL